MDYHGDKGEEAEEDEDDDEEDEDDDIGELGRTTTVRPAYAGVSSSSLGGLQGASSSTGSSAPSPKRMPIKNTFVHFDDSDRKEASPLIRAETDPTGSNVALPRWPSHHQRAVPAQLHDEEKDAGAEDDGCYLSGFDAELPVLSTPTASQDGPPVPSAPFPRGEMLPRPQQAPSGLHAPMSALQPAAFGMPAIACAPVWAPGGAAASWDGCEAYQLPPVDGPPLGSLHCFHREAAGFGAVSPDFRVFTKGPAFAGRLSVVSEGEVHMGGVHRYLVQFTSGELSRADGVGFVFASQLPCPKNIQRICSIFVNQRGMICMRIFGEVIKAPAHVKPLKIGDWVEVTMDLENRVSTFKLWTQDPNTGWPAAFTPPRSTAEFRFNKKFNRAGQTADKPLRLNAGYLACVVQNVDVTVTFGS